MVKRFKVGDYVIMLPEKEFIHLLQKQEVLLEYTRVFRGESDHNAPFVVKQSYYETEGRYYRGHELIRLTSPRKHRKMFWVPSVAFALYKDSWLECMPVEASYG